jgi:hypothetical protein
LETRVGVEVGIVNGIVTSFRFFRADSTSRSNGRFSKSAIPMLRHFSEMRINAMIEDREECGA